MNLEPMSLEPMNLEPMSPEPMNLEPMNLGCQEKKSQHRVEAFALGSSQQRKPHGPKRGIGALRFWRYSMFIPLF